MNVYRCAIPRVFVSNYCSNNKLSETASMFQGFTNTEEILMNNDPMFQIKTEGEPNTEDYSVYVLQNTPGLMDIARASPLFAVPLYSKENYEVLHMICEIPKGTKEKMEVILDDPGHPIKQDITDDGKLRVYKHGPIPWNYGMLPQTYEDPKVKCDITGLYGDGDPMDVIDIGSQTLSTGEVIKLKPLGVLPLIDEGEIDWKVIGINVKDELAEHLNDIDDVESILPGMLNEIKEWFRIYKVAENKPPNEFAMDGNYQNCEFVWKIVAEAHSQIYSIIPEYFRQYEEALKQQEEQKQKPKPKRPLHPYKKE